MEAFVNYFNGYEIPALFTIYIIIGWVFVFVGLTIISAKDLDPDKYLPINTALLILWPLVLFLPLILLIGRQISKVYNKLEKAHESKY